MIIILFFVLSACATPTEDDPHAPPEDDPYCEDKSAPDRLSSAIDAVLFGIFCFPK
ncbi:MAG: hypothetical protein ACJAU6_003894 [Alphaproteobacteria bacterium]|jgi:hypothetical protein